MTDTNVHPPPPEGYQAAVRFEYPKIKLQFAAIGMLFIATPGDTRADIRPRNRQKIDDFIGTKRSGGQVQQCLDLGNCPIGAPPGSHFSPVEDVLFYSR